MLVNGQPQDSLSLNDRAIHYGDGVFETVLVRDGQPLYWSEHLQRLQQGARTLKIPCDIAQLQAEAQQLLSTHQGLGVLKLILSRGIGGRGYTPPTEPLPSRIVQLHVLPAPNEQHTKTGITAQLCQHPLSRNPVLAGLKHLNRLDQVMASQELSPEASEGLMCDSEGLLIEGVKSNVFIVEKGALLTPALDQCGVAGIMRSKILQYAKSQGIEVKVTHIPLEQALNAEALFVCNSVFGIWPIVRIIGVSSEYRYSISPFAQSLMPLINGSA